MGWFKYQHSGSSTFRNCRYDWAGENFFHQRPNFSFSVFSPNVHGIYVQDRKHMYYPHQLSSDTIHIYIDSSDSHITSDESGTDENLLWDPKNRQMRFEQAVLKALVGARSAELQGKNRFRDAILREHGLFGTKITPIIYWKHLKCWSRS